MLHPDAHLPHRAHPDDAGADLRCIEDVVLRPGQRALVRTGIAVALPPGTVGLIHPRSGLAARRGLTIVNSPGTIDAGYRGEIKVCVYNTDATEAVSLPKGTRIAQFLVQKVELPHFVVTEELDNTERGSAGYGSTGTS